MIDWDATAAWIVLCAAIISPIITTLITGWQTRTLWKLQHTDTHHDEVIDTYIRCTSECLLNRSEANTFRYKTAYMVALRHVDSQSAALMETIDDHIAARNNVEGFALLNAFAVRNPTVMK